MRLLFLLSVTLWVSLFSYGVFAQAPIKNNFISQEEFLNIRKLFSSERCDIDKFIDESGFQGFRSVWRFYDDSPDEPEGQLADLGAESLCLIVMSSSFQAYRHKPPNKDGIVYPEKIGPKDIFPKGANVSELIFTLPKSLAPQKCVNFEGATAPYAISFEKKAGKLVRRIDALDAQ